jgi:hypothetical protein
MNQNPYWPNGQGSQKSQGGYPQMPGFPAGYSPTYSQAGNFPGQRGMNGPRGMAIQGALAPSMVQQQPMASPPPDDVFGNLIPGPKEAALGAVAGASVALTLNQLEEHKAIDAIANGLDKIPGVGYINNAITNRLKAASTATEGFWAGKGYWPSSLRELMHLKTFAHIESVTQHWKPTTEEEIRDAAEFATTRSVDAMQHRQLTSVLNDFGKRFSSNPATEEAYNALHTSVGRDAVNLLKPEKWLHDEQATFRFVLSHAEEQIEQLSKISNKTPAQKILHKRLLNLKERISGLNEYYLPLYKEQTALSARLQFKGTGPVGRTFANGINYLKRIFNGDTLRMSGNTAVEGTTRTAFQQVKSTLSKFALPGLAGALIFGASIKKAGKAKDGEKTQTFFHDFLGTAIGNFIGWEFGRKMLNSFQFSNKLLGKHALNTLPRIFGRTIPFLGTITLGGFVTEILAMFVVGGLFQNIAEKISDAIFGKPSEESLKGKSTSTPSSLQPNPAMLNMAMQQAMRKPQYQQAKYQQWQQGQPRYSRQQYFEGEQVQPPFDREQIRQRQYVMQNQRPLPKSFRTMPDPKIVPSLDEIRKSAAEGYDAMMQTNVKNSPWDYNNHIDPFDKHGI